MNRHDGVFHFRYWTSKTDHYTKSYPDFSLGGASNSGTQFIYAEPTLNLTCECQKTFTYVQKFYIRAKNPRARM